MGVALPVSYDVALDRVTQALRAEGFGVLTTIDVQKTLREKIGQAFRQYAILGACNPALAARALEADLDVGLLLPCNVIVYERGAESSAVVAMAPLKALGIVGNNEALLTVAREADERLHRALTRLVAT
jgi:uncharacterized protein (DUF302 family)